MQIIDRQLTAGDTGGTHLAAGGPGVTGLFLFFIVLSAGISGGAVPGQPVGAPYSTAEFDRSTASQSGEVIHVNAQEEMGGLAGLWTVYEIADAELPEEAEVTMGFGHGRIAGHAACNTYTAEIEVEGDRIMLGEMERDHQECDTELMEAEVHFMRVLEVSNRFEIGEGDTLTLLAQDRVMIRARRQ